MLLLSLAIFVEILNGIWIFAELFLAIVGAAKVHSWKIELDSTEPYDSLYLSYMALYFAAIILAVCFLVIVTELIANILLFRGLRQKKKSFLKAFVWITAIITVLSAGSNILFNISNGYYLFQDSINYKIGVIVFWSSKIVYSVFAVTCVLKLCQYLPYHKTNISIP